MAISPKDRIGKFRNVAFYFTSTDDTIGRKLAEHKFPGRDVSLHEDMGRETRTFSVSAYVWGPKAEDDAVKLQNALELPGPGQFHHPYYGVLQAVCTKVSVKRNAQTTNRVDFQLTFSESQDYGAFKVTDTASDQAAPESAVIDGLFGALAAQSSNRVSPKVVTAVESLQDGLVAMLASSFQVKGVPAFVSESAASVVAQLGGAVSDAVLSNVTLSGADLVGVQGVLQDMTQSPSDYVSAPDVLVTDLFATLQRLPRNTAALKAVLSATSIAAQLPAVPVETSTRRVEQANTALLNKVVNHAALGALAVQSAQASLPNRERGRTLKAQMDEAYANAIWAETDPGQVRALSTLGQYAHRAMSAAIGSADQVINVRLNAAQPALLVAQSIHGDKPETLLAEVEAISRENKVRHPLFLEGDSTVKVNRHV